MDVNLKNLGRKHDLLMPRKTEEKPSTISPSDKNESPAASTKESATPVTLESSPKQTLSALEQLKERVCIRFGHYIIWLYIVLFLISNSFFLIIHPDSSEATAKKGS
jgi:hypothetical protein